jgi:hypothetical protein
MKEVQNNSNFVQIFSLCEIFFHSRWCQTKVDIGVVPTHARVNVGEQDTAVIVSTGR